MDLNAVKAYIHEEENFALIKGFPRSGFTGKTGSRCILPAGERKTL